MIKKTLPALVILSMGLTACTDSDDADQSLSKDGYWVAPAYGVALNIEPSDYRYYQYTGNTCQSFDLFDETLEQLRADVELAQGEQVLLNSFFGQKVPAIEFERQASLPESCVSSLVANADEEGFQSDAVRDFDIFWQNFNDYYAFFELKQVDWTQLRDTWRPEVTAETSDEDLLAIFANMIEPLADGHVSVMSADEEFEYDSGGKPTLFDVIESEYEQLPAENDIDLEGYFDEQLDLVLEIIADSFDEDASINEHESEMALWSVLPNNIGYVNLFGMEEFADSSLAVDQHEAIDLMFDNIFTDLADVDSMIIDLRFNGGGDDSNSVRIASRFTDARTLAWSKQARLGNTRLPLENVYIEPTTRSSFLKPVVLLTSAATASAAEVFVLAMQQIADAQLVGEATQGIFSDTLPKYLPSGISFSISNEYYLSANGEFYEGQGIPVDVEAAFAPIEDRQNMLDTGLMTAQELLRN